MDFEYYFQSHILERGRYYYNIGNVINLEKNEDTISAKVIGSKDYYVEIKLNNGEVHDLLCTCPYAEKGNHCKHMAAVLFAYENEREKQTLDKSNNKSNKEIIDLVENTDYSIVKDFLVDLLVKNPKLENEFRIWHDQPIPKDNIDYYKSKIDDLISELANDNDMEYYYQGYYGFEEIYETSQDLALEELEEFLRKDINKMINHDHNESAWMLTNYIWEALLDLDVSFDNYLDVDEVINLIWATWLDLYEESDDDFKNEMFAWFIEKLKETESVDILHILTSVYQEEKYQRKTLETINKIIDLYLPNNSNKESLIYYESWVISKAEILENLGVDYDEISSFLEKYTNSTKILIFYAEFLKENCDNQKAINLLKKGIKANEKSRSSYRYEYRLNELLASIYLDENDKENYIEQIKYMFTEFRPGDLDLWIEFKSVFEPNEWIIERDNFLATLPESINLYEIYIEEDMIDELAKSVFSDGFFAIETYEKYLKEDYSQEILEYYKDYVIKKSDSTGRKHYQEIARVLRKMQKYSGGEELVEILVKLWRIKFKTRPAMMDELREF